jgi:hypothetical protein
LTIAPFLGQLAPLEATACGNAILSYSNSVTPEYVEGSDFLLSDDAWNRGKGDILHEMIHLEVDRERRPEILKTIHIEIRRLERSKTTSNP